MKIHFDNFLEFVRDNWFPIAAFTSFAVSGIVWVDGMNHFQQQTTSILVRVDKNTGSIAKVLLKEGILNPNEVELTQNK